MTTSTIDGDFCTVAEEMPCTPQDILGKDLERTILACAIPGVVAVVRLLSNSGAQGFWVGVTAEHLFKDSRSQAEGVIVELQLITLTREGWVELSFHEGRVFYFPTAKLVGTLLQQAALT